MGVSRVRTSAELLSLGLCVALLVTARGPAAAGPRTNAPPPLPKPFAFVSSLDLECFRTEGPPLHFDLIKLTQLNPVLREKGLPTQEAKFLDLVRTCVPVMKNDRRPDPDAERFVEHVDFACYKLDIERLRDPIGLRLGHLNPVLKDFPDHEVKLIGASELCVPVGKNGKELPEDVLRLVQYLDLECFDLDHDEHRDFALSLTQLNPQLQRIAKHEMVLTSRPRQLCVPVQKNEQDIPGDVREVVQWVDLERFFALRPVEIPGVGVRLNHLNPLFVRLPDEFVDLKVADALMVPVSKDGRVPP